MEKKWKETEGGRERGPGEFPFPFHPQASPTSSFAVGIGRGWPLNRPASSATDGLTVQSSCKLHEKTWEEEENKLRIADKNRLEKKCNEALRHWRNIKWKCHEQMYWASKLPTGDWTFEMTDNSTAFVHKIFKILIPMPLQSLYTQCASWAHGQTLCIFAPCLNVPHSSWITSYLL